MNYKKQLLKDKLLATILPKENFTLSLQKNISVRLMESIISQQLSTKVAAIIFKRFIDIYNGKEPKPQQVIDTSSEVLRAIGLSNNKVKYIQNVATFCVEHNITDKKLAALENEEIIQLLTQIKGVGKWTVEMLLMFSLGREDVFAVDDLGIQQAMTQLYQLNATNKKEMQTQMVEIANYWKPYRTYACLHLWKWKDTVKK